MDGFRERLNGRYERSSSRGDRYDRADRQMDDRYDRPMDDRYDRVERPMDDRYDRMPRRQPEGASSEVIAELVDKSNRNQLEIIAELFDEAKADRLDSERAIIEAVSGKIAEAAAAAPAPAPVAEPVVTPAPVVETIDNEALLRIERMAGQNAESINESGEIIERSYNSLRMNTELLNDIKTNMSDIQASQEDIKNQTQYLAQNISQTIAAAIPVADAGYGQGSGVNTDEIMAAIGDNRSLLNMLRQDIVASMQAQQPDPFAEAEKAEDSAAVTAEAIDKYFKDLEEHVHKECVKCYRNVESKLEEQNAESIKKIEKKASSSLIPTIVSVVLNVVTIGLLVCQILGIFG